MPAGQAAGPVFIVGMNGSGTTMMLDHLGRHPRLFGLSVETYILPHYLLSEGRYGDLEKDANFRKLWDDMRAEYSIRRSNRNRPFELPHDWQQTPRSAAGVFDRMLVEFATREGKSRWCEKTPLYALHINRLKDAFPSAKFVHMVRDGRDCAVSNHRRWGRHPAATVYRWKHVVVEARRQGAMIPRDYLEVRYEDLTSDPVQYMRRVCEFIDEDFDERILSVERLRKGMPGHDSQEIVRNEDRNRGYFSDERLRDFDAMAGKVLAQLGYPTGQPDGDAEAGSATRLWWFLHDSWFVLTRQIRNKMFRQRNMTWTLWFLRVKGIIRHLRSSSADDPDKADRRRGP